MFLSIKNLSFLALKIGYIGTPYNRKSHHGSDIINLDLLLKIDARSIEFSPQDVNRGLKLPTKVTPELAEETGIHIGDGCMGARPKGKYTEYRYEISSGNNDKNYIDNYVIPLMEKLSILVIDCFCGIYSIFEYGYSWANIRYYNFRILGSA